MKFTVHNKTIDVAAVRVRAPLPQVPADDIDAPPHDARGIEGMLLANGWITGGWWDFTVRLDDLVIEGVRDCDCFWLVGDRGSYWLLDAAGKSLAALENSRIPGRLISSAYNEYLRIQIRGGKVQRWPDPMSIDEFFPTPTKVRK